MLQHIVKKSCTVKPFLDDAESLFGAKSRYRVLPQPSNDSELPYARTEPLRCHSEKKES